MISGTPNKWSLHAQLARDTLALGDLALSRVLMMNDANYPWLVLVPRRAGLVEILDLAEDDQARLMSEITGAARVLKQETTCDKLNIAALGNMVPQLHVHIIARRHGDAAWPKPVWGAAPPVAYQPDARERLIAALQHGLQIAADRD